ncbi:MAG: membrane protein insertase YidC, partial [Deltaproteobacteria bacterium]|nr:membrane protein insertase YidC [Deltaproteobacteria bacterium]
MEKRTILAFILSFLVFIIWAQLFTPKTGIPVNEHQRAEENISQETFRESAGLPAEPAEPVLSQPEIEDLVNTAAEKKIVIETPLYKALFTNRGPALIGFQLKKYRESIDPESPSLELFKINEQIKRHVSFYFNNPLIKQGTDLVFTTDREAVSLGEGQGTETLLFRHSTPEGITVEQLFSFSPDRYDISVKIRVFNGSEKIATGNIRSVIS